MVFRKIINSMLGRDFRVIVPINCNVPDHDDEYIEIEAMGEPAE